MVEIVDDLLNNIEANNLEIAEDIIVKYQSSMCKNVEFLKAMALFYIKVGKCFFAIQILKKAVSICPEDEEIYYYLAYAYEYKENDSSDLTFSMKNLANNCHSNKKRLFNERQKIQNALVGLNGPLVSIIVLCKNFLETTKLCIECILKYTKDIDYELIIVNESSLTDSMNFFKTIPYDNKKIIQVSNSLNCLSKQVGLKEATGKYLLFIDEYIFVTENWLKNMLICLESDITIGIAMPCSNKNATLNQAQIVYKNFDDMQQQAKEFNISDKSKWEEQLVVKEGVLLCRKACIDTIGFYDYGFIDNFVEDLSFRYRRGGYKLVLCGDTYVYCFNDRLTEDHRPGTIKNWQTDLIMFEKKFCDVNFNEDIAFEYEKLYQDMVNTKRILSGSQISILGVDVKCGRGILSLKNYLRNKGFFNVKLSAVTTKAKYWLDLKTICDDEVYVEDEQCLFDKFYGTSFDYIILGNCLNTYEKPYEILKKMLLLLKLHGQIFLEIKNYHDMEFWRKYYKVGRSSDEEHGWTLTKEDLCSFLMKYNAVIASEFTDKNELDQVSENMIQEINLPNKEFMEKLKTKRYFFSIKKSK